MEALVLGTPLLYASFAIVFVVGVVLGYFVISLIGSS
ncbi:MAG: hypothetical protein METHSR3v1_1770004 [Methanothrix sp.]|jgi:hypothetical protein|nr:MAG: hypothetical protein A4E43_01131 [Methanosaeta sp. PtaB.Bin005]UEC41022.1 MAG: hypothetical protein METHSR3v1_1770004 [Methanothrix sp.]